MSNELTAWFKAACVRALKTAAQSALGVIGATAYFGSVDWLMVGSSALLAAIVSLLTSVAGIPEIANGDSVFKIAGTTDDDA